MFEQYGLNLYDFDIYSRRISFFYNKRDRVGTPFGLFLTFFYVFMTIILFIYYFIKTLKRTEVTSHESTVYYQGIPSIDINPNLFYFAFGLESPITLSRYIDESIYYPKVFYIKQQKKNGILITTEQISLDIERCDVHKFGKDYQSQFTKGELNNSYCLKNFNLTLLGGSKYDISSFIQIKTYPCVNKTENNNLCKPHEIIDYYLTSGYFSIVIKDIGLNPLNYTFPIIPTIQNLKTNVDKTMCRESLIYLGIAHVQTDVGLLINNIKTNIYLQYRKYSQSFYFINQTEYFEGKEIFSAQIKLEEYIHVMKREYTKMSQVFSIIGGYMQLISTIFVLIKMLTKNMTVEKKVINKLFNFNLKQRKLLLSIGYQKKLNYSIHFQNDEKNSFIPFEVKKILKRKINQQNNINKNDIWCFKSNNSFVPLNKNNFNDFNDINNMKMTSSHKTILTHKINKFSRKSMNNTKLDDAINNKSNFIMIFKDEELKNNSFEKKKIKKNKGIMTGDSKELKSSENELISNIDFKFYDYICCLGKYRHNIQKVELFNFGVSFYRHQMNIINIFNLIFLTKIMLTEHRFKNNNIFNQIIEIPINYNK